MPRDPAPSGFYWDLTGFNDTLAKSVRSYLFDTAVQLDAPNNVCGAWREACRRHPITETTSITEFKQILGSRLAEVHLKRVVNLTSPFPTSAGVQSTEKEKTWAYTSYNHYKILIAQGGRDIEQQLIIERRKTPMKMQNDASKANPEAVKPPSKELHPEQKNHYWDKIYSNLAQLNEISKTLRDLSATDDFLLDHESHRRTLFVTAVDLQARLAQEILEQVDLYIDWVDCEVRPEKSST
jgi:hypothetical protein